MNNSDKKKLEKLNEKIKDGFKNDAFEDYLGLAKDIHTKTEKK